MEALVLVSENKTAQVIRVPKPVPSDDQILVRTLAVALNPVDALYTFNPLGTSGRIVGSDFSGVVESVGVNMPASVGLQVGTPVAGFLQGACSVNERPGAFAEYLVVDWDLAWRVPDTLSTEAAATVSLCALTAAQCLFYRLGVGYPFAFDEHGMADAQSTGRSGQSPMTVFIYGASTSLGLYAAQLARRGAAAEGRQLRLYGTASRSHHEMLRSPPYQYDGIVDYRDAD